MIAGLLSVVSATSANAASACTFKVQLPTRISLTQATQTWSAPLAVNCPAAASFSLQVKLVGTSMPPNVPATLPPLNYSTGNRSASFGLAGCDAGYDYGQAGTYTATLVSAHVTDANGHPVAGVQLLPSSVQALPTDYAYSASSRRGSAVYINGLFKLYGGAVIEIYPAGYPEIVCGLVRFRATVYLQRYLPTGWQTVLARTPNSNGQVAVGFVQPKVFQYRWVIVTPATHSASTFR